MHHSPTLAPTSSLPPLSPTLALNSFPQRVPQVAAAEVRCLCYDFTLGKRTKIIF